MTCAMKTASLLAWVCWVVIAAGGGSLAAFIELPQFSQMALLYPGYARHGGRYGNAAVVAMIGGGGGGGGGGGNSSRGGHARRRNTAALRLSRAFNRYGGRHAIGVAPVRLSAGGRRQSYRGADGLQYVYRSAAFGPYLAARYGPPTVTARPADGDRPFRGRQGILRLVGVDRRPAGVDRRRSRTAGHAALWDCDRFYEAPDWWATERNIVGAELWQTPDSHCPLPESAGRRPADHPLPPSPESAGRRPADHPLPPSLESAGRRPADHPLPPSPESSSRRPTHPLPPSPESAGRSLTNHPPPPTQRRNATTRHRWRHYRKQRKSLA